MKFDISRYEFLNELTKVSKAISIKSPIFQLTGIKIEAKDNTLFFTGSDNELTIHSYIEKNDNFTLNIEKEGSIVLPAKYIIDIVRKINDDIITIDIIDGDLTLIKSKTSEFKIKGLENEKNKYPEMDFSKPSNVVTLNSEKLKKLIQQTIFATSDKEVRPVLTGINLKINKNDLEFIATDSYRLAKKVEKVNQNFSINVTVPKKCLDEVSKLIEEEGEIEFSINEKKIQFIMDNTIIQSRLIEGAYPETSRLIPNTFEYELEIEAKAFLDAIDRASLMSSEGKNIVKLSMSSDEIIISANNHDIGGSSKEELIFKSYKGDKLNISFSARYVIEALRALNCENVKICFSGDMRPFVIKDVDDNSIVQLILPVKTND